MNDTGGKALQNPAAINTQRNKAIVVVFECLSHLAAESAEQSGTKSALSVNVNFDLHSSGYFAFAVVQTKDALAPRKVSANRDLFV